MLSEYKKILAKASIGSERATTARQKIIACIDTIRENGGVVGAAVTADLKKLGIVIDDNA